MKALLFLLCFSFVFVACGKPPCAALADQCATCGVVGATACRATATVNVETACQLALDSKLYVAGSASCGAIVAQSSVPQGVTGPTGLLPTDEKPDTKACSYAQVQTLSEPCCESYGVDACGAGLFCASFDTRTIGTCYALRSRADMSECSEDEQCQSGKCNTKKKQCLSQQYGLCDVAVGCADNAFGTATSCVVDTDGDRRCKT